MGEWTFLPAEGRAGKPPPLPPRRPARLVTTKKLWAEWWRSPMATQWIDADVPVLLRLLDMLDDRARGKIRRGLDAEVRQLEDRYGMTPRGRQMLRWRIAEPEPAMTSDDATVLSLRRRMPLR